MANIFGGVYSAVFVVREGSGYDIPNGIKDCLTIVENDCNSLIEFEGSRMNNSIAKQLSGGNGRVGMVMDISPERNRDAILIICYVDVSDYNRHFANRGPDNAKDDTTSMILDYVGNLKRKAISGKAIDAAMTGLLTAINTGYDDSLVFRSDAEKIDEKSFIPSVCTIGDNGLLAEEVCHCLLDKEKIVIGETMKDICGLGYIPEVPDCNWTDVPYIEKLIKFRYKPLLGSSRCEEVFKIRLMQVHIPEMSVPLSEDD